MALVAQLIALAAAVAAWRAAHAASSATTATRNAAQGQLMADLLDDYAAEDMREAVVSLRNWREERGDGFAREFARLRKEDYTAVEPFDQARRRFALYCYKVHRLHLAQLLDHRVLDAVMPRDTAEFGCEFVEPLEAGVRVNYRPEAYEWMATLRNVARYQHLFPPSVDEHSGNG